MAKPVSFQWRCIFMLFIFPAFFSCGGVPANQDHAVWRERVVERFNQLKDVQPDMAIFFLDSSYALASDISVADRWVKYRAKVDFYAVVRHDQGRRWQYIDSMEALLKDRYGQLKDEHAQTLLEKGRAYAAEKKLSLAFDCYFEGRNFSVNSLDSCSLSDFTNALGQICFRKEEYLQAAGYFRDSYEQVRYCRPGSNAFYYSFILPQGLLNSIGVSFERAGKIDSAIRYYERALAFVKDGGRQWVDRGDFVQTAVGVIEGNLGGTYMLQGRYTEAEIYLRSSIGINDRPGFAIEDAQTAKAKLAHLYLLQGKLRRADTLIGELGHEISVRRGKSEANADVVQQWLGLKWQYAEAVHDISGAYDYMKRYHILEDSIRQQNAAIYKADVDDALSERSRKYEHALLKKDSRFTSLMLVCVTVIGFMSVLLAVIGWWNFSRSRAHVRSLQATNAQKRTVIAALMQSEKRNQQMMRIVAHDLRNPIGAIVSAATMVTSNKEANGADQTLWRLVKNAGDNALKLVSDLLHAEVKELPRKPVDLESLLHYCADLMQHKIMEKGQHLRLITEPVTLLLHQDSFWRVVVNLIANASKFSPRGAVITLSLESMDTGVLIVVQDRGIGIPPEMQQKIFDGVSQAQRQGTDGEESFGLGLAASRKIVEEQGGKMWCESDEAVGTKFYIHFGKVIVV